MSAASFPSAGNYPLQMSGNNLQMGNMSIPIRNARHCWIYPPNVVHVICQSKKGNQYQADISLQMQSVEKTKKCMELLISKTSARISPPHMKSIKPEPRLVSFDFAAEDEAQEFGTYYAPCFFPEGEFHSKFEGKRYIVISKTEKDCIDRINQILASLDSRVFDHFIEEKLHENGDPRFPGRVYPKELVFGTPPPFSGVYEPGFVVSPEKIQRIVWLANHKRSEVPTDCRELDAWLNERLDEDYMLDKKTWQVILNEIKAVGKAQFNPLIEKIETLLRGNEKFTPKILEELGLTFEPFISDQLTTQHFGLQGVSKTDKGNTELGLILQNCFTNAVNLQKAKDRKD